MEISFFHLLNSFGVMALMLYHHAMSLAQFRSTTRTGEVPPEPKPGSGFQQKGRSAPRGAQLLTEEYSYQQEPKPWTVNCAHGPCSITRARF